MGMKLELGWEMGMELGWEMGMKLEMGMEEGSVAVGAQVHRTPLW